MADYIYDQSWEQERARLAGLEAALDPGTFRILDHIGVGSGWRCLEVGGGGGSVTRWLRERVGPDGSVVATDLDPRFIAELAGPTVEIRTHNIVTDPLETEAFDLVHSRDVLEHIPEREAALERMVAALKPGGWIMVEDVDFDGGSFATGVPGEPDETTPLLKKMFGILSQRMRERGIDPEYGRRLPWRLAARGLVEVDGEARSRLFRAGSAHANLPALTMTHLRPMILASGEMTEAELDRLFEAASAPDFMGFAPLHVAAWGRKP